MSMYFLKIIVVSLLITLDCDIQPAFFKANPIHNYGCDGSKPTVCIKLSLSLFPLCVPGWIVALVLIVFCVDAKFIDH